MAFLVISKPHFIYDENKKQYKQFGKTKDKTLFTLPVIAIFLAVLLVVIFGRLGKSKSKKLKKYKYKYIPVNYIPDKYPFLSD